MNRVVSAVFLLLPATQIVVAQDRVWTELASSGESQQLAYSSCPSNECFHEAISHVLGCSGPNREGYLRIVDHPAALTMATLFSDPKSDAPASLSLVSGEDRQEIPVDRIEMTLNPMNGSWDVEFGSPRFGEFYDQIMREGPNNQSVEVADYRIDLSPNSEAEARLAAVAMLCSDPATSGDPRG